MSKIKHWSIHPLLFAAYPVFTLFASNIDQIKSTAIVRSLLLSVVAAVVIWLILYLMMKDWRRSAILVSLYLVLFFSYGHIYHYLEAHSILGLFLGRHRVLAILWLLLTVLGTWAALYKTQETRKVTEALNSIGVALIVMSVVMMLVYSIRINTVDLGQTRVFARDGQIYLHSSPQMPDIYYIVLDAYAREDVLKKKFDLDNSAFIGELEKMGFYVADCSQSNYGFTNFSLASTLDMDYMDKISERYLGGKMDLIWLPELLQENEVRQNLEQLGYTIVSFENDYFNLLWDDADVIYRKNPDRLSKEHK